MLFKRFAHSAGLVRKAMLCSIAAVLQCCRAGMESDDLRRCQIVLFVCSVLRSFVC